MKTDFGAIREELQKLTDVEYLKKELSRAASEIRKFDVDKLNLSPEAKAKLKTLEKRFNEVVVRVRVLEKQVDKEVGKLIVILRKTKADAESRFRAFANGKSAPKRKKATKKKATRKKARH